VREEHDVVSVGREMQFRDRSRGESAFSDVTQRAGNPFRESDRFTSNARFSNRFFVCGCPPYAVSPNMTLPRALGTDESPRFASAPKHEYHHTSPGAVGGQQDRYDC